MISILLVDDHNLVRAGIKRILNNEEDFNVVHDVASGEEALIWFRNHAVNIILMEVHMPTMDGIETTKRILCSRPKTKVIALTAPTHASIASQMLQVGASGFLTKTETPEKMIQAIRTVHAGGFYITPEIAQQLATKQTVIEKENPVWQLSDRELQIMLMVVKGLKVNDIAEKLHLSPKTVNSYRYRIFEKLNIHNDVELTHFAIHYHLIPSNIIFPCD